MSQTAILQLCSVNMIDPVLSLQRLLQTCHGLFQEISINGLNIVTSATFQNQFRVAAVIASSLKSWIPQMGFRSRLELGEATEALDIIRKDIAEGSILNKIKNGSISDTHAPRYVISAYITLFNLHTQHYKNLQHYTHSSHVLSLKQLDAAYQKEIEIFKLFISELRHLSNVSALFSPLTPLPPPSSGTLNFLHRLGVYRVFARRKPHTTQKAYQDEEFKEEGHAHELLDYYKMHLRNPSFLLNGDMQPFAHQWIAQVWIFLAKYKETMIKAYLNQDKKIVDEESSQLLATASSLQQCYRALAPYLNCKFPVDDDV